MVGITKTLCTFSLASSLSDAKVVKIMTSPLHARMRQYLIAVYYMQDKCSVIGLKDL